MKSRTDCQSHVCQQAHCKKVQVLAVNSQFCADHVCSECVVGGAGSEVRPKSGPGASCLCTEHRCSLAECAEPRFRPAPDRCVYHICRECAKEGALSYS